MAFGERRSPRRWVTSYGAPNAPGVLRSHGFLARRAGFLLHARVSRRVRRLFAARA